MGVRRTVIESLGVEVSRLGFGAMRLPKLENGKIDRELAGRMIDAAYKAGVNYYDTAYIYHNGESQRFLGEHMKKYPRDSFYFATKLPIWQCKTLDDVKQKFAEQVRDCDMGYFDFFLIHSMDQERLELIKKIGAYEWLLEQKRAGIIRRLGFSYHGNFDAFKELVENYEVDFVQIQINYADDVLGRARRFYDLATEKKLPIFVMEPVRGGGLAILPDKAAEIIAEFEAAGGAKLSQAAWAFRWCTDKDNLRIILSGMSNMEQVEDNLRTFSDCPVKLTGDEAKMIERLREVFTSSIAVPCTGCGYCMDCPFGVDIPNVFKQYNQYMIFGNPNRALEEYGCLQAISSDGGHCAKCGVCMTHCPQGINIPEKIEEAHGIMSTIVRPSYNWQSPGAKFTFNKIDPGLNPGLNRGRAEPCTQSRD